MNRDQKPNFAAATALGAGDRDAFLMNAETDKRALYAAPGLFTNV
jgi:hypothetical protein